MIQVKQYDHVILKDGREGCAVEILGGEELIVDIGTSPEDWETIYGLTIDDIAEVIPLG